MRSRSWPARPTNGRPIRSSSPPGASPTSMMRAPGAPSAKTSWVAVAFRAQPLETLRALCAGVERLGARRRVSRAARAASSAAAVAGASRRARGAGASLRRTCRRRAARAFGRRPRLRRLRDFGEAVDAAFRRARDRRPRRSTSAAARAPAPGSSARQFSADFIQTLCSRESRRFDRMTRRLVEGAGNPAQIASHFGMQTNGGRARRSTRGKMEQTNCPPGKSMEYDVVIVGAGPAGLAAAIRLKQLDANRSVVVVEKGSTVGAHILSGAVIDPIGLDRLLPDWRDDPERPLKTPVTQDRFMCSVPPAASRLPNWPMPQLMNNHGNFIGSLGAVDALAGRARPRRSASRSIRASPPPNCFTATSGEVVGVATGDMGVGRDGKPKAEFHPRHGAARQIRADRRGRARLARQAAHRQIRARRRTRAAKIRHRPQGGLAGRAREASSPAWCSTAFGWPLGTRRDRRLVPLSLRRPPGRGRLRRPSQLHRTRHCRRSTNSSASRPIR